MQALVEQTFLTCRLLRTMESVEGRCCVHGESAIGNSDPATFVHDAQVAVVWVHFTGDWGIQTFDFSRRGFGSLPLWGAWGGEIERNTRSEDCRDVRFKPLDNMDPWDLEPLGDGSLFYLVSCLSQSVGSEVTC